MNRPEVSQGQLAPVSKKQKTTAQEAATGTSAPGDTAGGSLGIQKYEYHIPDTLPWTETRTVRCIWEGYLSINAIGKTFTNSTGSIVNGFDLLHNHPYQPIAVSFVDQGASTVAPTFGPGIYMAKAGTTNATTPSTTIQQFPRQMTGTSGTNLQVGVAQNNIPSWVRWFDKLYRYYAVLESTANVTISYGNNESAGSSESGRVRDVLCAYWNESYVQSNQSDIRPSLTTTVVQDGTSNAKRTVPVGRAQLKKYKGIQYAKLGNALNVVNRQASPTTTSFQHTWRNDGKDLGSVRNITDIQTWYPTGSAPSPTWAENTSCAFILADNATDTANVNVHIKMEYIIQYKDLKDAVKYVAEPTHGNDAIHLRPGIDDVQFPYPLENHRTTPYLPAVPAYSIV